MAPKRNEQDADDVPEHLRHDLDFVFVDDVREVLEVALEPVRQDASGRARVVA